MIMNEEGGGEGGAFIMAVCMYCICLCFDSHADEEKNMTAMQQQQ